MHCIVTLYLVTGAGLRTVQDTPVEVVGYRPFCAWAKHTPDTSGCSTKPDQSKIIESQIGTFTNPYTVQKYSLPTWISGPSNVVYVRLFCMQPIFKLNFQNLELFSPLLGVAKYTGRGQGFGSVVIWPAESDTFFTGFGSYLEQRTLKISFILNKI